MNEERLMILTMLEEGKISSEDAAKLIEALDERELKEFENQGIKTGPQTKKETATSKPFIINHKFHSKDTKDWEQKLEEKLENIGKKISAKVEVHEDDMEELGNKIGEKMSRVGADIAEGATSFTDKILDMVDNLVDKGTFTNMFGSYETITEELEKDISNMTNPSLAFEAINGKITVIPWDKEHVYVKAICQVKRNTHKVEGTIYEVIEKEDKIIFIPRYANNIATKLEVYLPDRSYDKIELITSNGKIEAKDIKTDNILCDTTNASISLNDIATKNFKASSSNGKINLKDISSEAIHLKTTNGSIVIEDIHSETIDAVTKNGKVCIRDINSQTLSATTNNSSIFIEDCDASFIKAKNSNGKVVVENILTTNLKELNLYTTNDSIDVSLDNMYSPIIIEAETSMGNIDIGIPNIIYKTNVQKHLGKKKILAHTSNYEDGSNAVNVVTSTSNGSIKIS